MNNYKMELLEYSGVFFFSSLLSRLMVKEWKIVISTPVMIDNNGRKTGYFNSIYKYFLRFPFDKVSIFLRQKWSFR